MKIRISIAIFLALTGLLGCKNDLILVGLGEVSMTAEINGDLFEADEVMATRNPASTGIGKGFTVEGLGISGLPSISLTLYSSSLGNYNLGVQGPGNSIAIFTAMAGASQESDWGSISIDEMDYSEGGIVKGTFVFVAASDSITNGTFEARFSN